MNIACNPIPPLSQPPGFLALHAAVLLPPAVVSRLRHLDDATDLDDGHPGPVWPDEDSHSPWTDFRGPRQRHYPNDWWRKRSGLSY